VGKVASGSRCRLVPASRDFAHAVNPARSDSVGKAHDSPCQREALCNAPLPTLRSRVGRIGVIRPTAQYAFGYCALPAIFTAYHQPFQVIQNGRRRGSDLVDRLENLPAPDWTYLQP
jgi:hypothetical protein